ncbi:MAG: 3D domain-containing protein [archaeon]
MKTTIIVAVLALFAIAVVLLWPHQQATQQITGEIIRDPHPTGPPNYPGSGQAYTTIYNTPLEDEYDAWCVGCDITSSQAACVFADRNRHNPQLVGFYEEVLCQGGGIGTNGEAYTGDGKSPIRIKPSKADSTAAPTLGKAYHSSEPPIVGRTIAVNPFGPETCTAKNYNADSPYRCLNCNIPYGSKVYLEFDEPDNPWTGWYVAEDTGGALYCTSHIDVYVGIGKESNPAFQSGMDWVSGKNPKVWVFPKNDPFPPAIPGGTPLLGEKPGKTQKVAGEYLGSYSYLPFIDRTVQYDFAAYNHLKEFSTEIVHDCNDNLEQCFTEHVTTDNATYELSKHCSDDPFFTFIEQLYDCNYINDTNCYCPLSGQGEITLEGSATMTAQGGEYAFNIPFHTKVEGQAGMPSVQHLSFGNTLSYSAEDPDSTLDNAVLVRSEQGITFSQYTNQRLCRPQKQHYPLCLSFTNGSQTEVLRTSNGRTTRSREAVPIRIGITLTDTVPPAALDVSVTYQPLTPESGNVIVTWPTPSAEEHVYSYNITLFLAGQEFVQSILQENEALPAASSQVVCQQVCFAGIDIVTPGNLYKTPDKEFFIISDVPLGTYEILVIPDDAYYNTPESETVPVSIV